MSLPRRNGPVTGLEIPPRRLWRDRRPLKRWRYLGAYGPDVMLCAGDVRIGGAPQSFWAVWDGHELRERTSYRGGSTTEFGPARLRVEPDGEEMQVVSPHGRSYIWTRKTPVRVTGTVDGRDVDLRGIVDESAGYHARRTSWTWSAGVGRTAQGERVAWNLVEGIHDAPTESERTVWVDGTATEAPPLPFAADLSSVGELRFAAEAERARHDRLLLLDSQYRQPFGRFAGTLPGGVEVAEGWGVMERHDVRW